MLAFRACSNVLHFPPLSVQQGETDSSRAEVRLPHLPSQSPYKNLLKNNPIPLLLTNQNTPNGWGLVLGSMKSTGSYKTSAVG